ncbi:hypothetical protein H0H81_008690 [Sphagnurus paluster]|uniref:Uncharacterized protein n=1 Tax=Sphagnurus paluster TaxID=117069 RepID=A0A9P7K5E6_9AGAR|nr:hypothetical protein H0H81_008690 [Sphagnurus paluster]
MARFSTLFVALTLAACQFGVQAAPLSSRAIDKNFVQCNLARIKTVAGLASTNNAMKQIAAADAATTAALTAAQASLKDAQAGVNTIARALVSGQAPPTASRDQVLKGLNAAQTALDGITAQDAAVVNTKNKLKQTIAAGQQVVDTCGGEGAKGTALPAVTATATEVSSSAAAGTATASGTGSEVLETATATGASSVVLSGDATATGTGTATATGTDAATATGTDAATVTGTDVATATGTDAATATGTDASTATGTDAATATGTDAATATGTDAVTATGTDAATVTPAPTGGQASATEVRHSQNIFFQSPNNIFYPNLSIDCHRDCVSINLKSDFCSDRLTCTPSTVNGAGQRGGRNGRNGRNRGNTSSAASASSTAADATATGTATGTAEAPAATDAAGEGDAELPEDEEEVFAAVTRSRFVRKFLFAFVDEWVADSYTVQKSANSVTSVATLLVCKPDAAAVTAVKAAQDGVKSAKDGVSTIAKALLTGQNAPAASRDQVGTGLEAAKTALASIKSTDAAVTAAVADAQAKVEKTLTAGKTVVSECK